MSGSTCRAAVAGRGCSAASWDRAILHSLPPGQGREAESLLLLLKCTTGRFSQARCRLGTPACGRRSFSAPPPKHFHPHIGGGSPVSHLPALAFISEPRLGSCRVVPSCRAPTAASELTWVWIRRPPGLADFMGVNTLRLVSRRLRDF
jgi:hypothetical protein